MLSRLRSMTRALLRRRAFEGEMSEELRFHLEEYTEELVRSGLPRAEAARRARLELGPIDSLQDDCRDARGLRFFDELHQDVRLSLRRMRQAPLFTGAVVLSLGLGIGANTAIFSLADAVLLRTLPVQAPEKLYFLAHGDGEAPSTSSNYPMLERYRSLTDVFTGIAAYSMQTFKVPHGGAVDLVPGQFVSGNYHALIAPPFVLGRGFTSEPDRPGDAAPPAVISEAYWTERFARDPKVLGTTLSVEGVTASIVGVTDGRFAGLVPGTRADITLPLSVKAAQEPDFLTRHDGWTSMPLVGRLKPGVRAETAQAATDTVFQQFMSEPGNRWARDQTPNTYRSARLVPAGRGSDGLRARYAVALRVLLLLVAVVLIIASANVASLLLAQATGRAKEVAIRLCIGGGRSRLIRQFLTESTLLAAAGAACGIVLASWSTQALAALLHGGPQPFTLDVHPNARVLAATAVVSLAVGLLVGLVPALRASRVDLTPALKENADVWGCPRHKPRAGRLLVVTQLALSLVVVVLAALLGRTLHNLRSVDAGFDADRILLLSVDTSGSGLTKAQLPDFYSSLVDSLRSLPGVVATAASTMTPISTSGSYRGLHMPHLSDTPETRGVWENVVTPGYFETLRVGLVAGRLLGPQDVADGRRVAVVNQAMARFYFADEDPIGREISFRTAPDDKLAIVGVVCDVHHESLRKAPPRMVYTPLAQTSQVPARVTLELRTRHDPMAMAGTARGAVRLLARDAVITRVRTMEQQVEASLVRERALATLSASFALLALLLACLGLYALFSYEVVRRTRDIGIRLALGATRGSVLRAVLSEAASLSVAGVLLGTVAALGAARTVTTIVFGLAPRDPLTLAAAAVALIGTACLAGLLPARRAAALDPGRVLRAE